MKLFGGTRKQVADAWPTEFRFNRGRRMLTIAYDDGFTGKIPFELLRVESPSAEVQGHGAKRPPPPAGKRSIDVSDAQQVGRYALRITFSDGHDSGFFTWAYLRDLAQNAGSRMKAYEARLASAGLSRD